MKKRLFVDMDGTLAVFTPQKDINALYQKGYFASLAPQENVVEAIRFLARNTGECEIYTLSAYLADSPFALPEKDAWIGWYLPEIDRGHRLFVTCGRNKKEVIAGGVTETDFLLDDFTKNLVSWKPGRGIKLLNGINHTRESWQYDRIRYDREPEELANAILSVMDGNAVMD